jgi:putative ABC transport system substrate-binding protein
LAYNAAEDNSVYQIGVAKAHIESLGLTWREVTVATTNDVQQAITSLAGQVDAIYVPNDNTLASTMPVVYTAAAGSKTPVVVADISMVEAGGLATLGLDYYNVGYETGLMAVKILNDGANPATMPIQYSTEFSYVINGTVADELGITIPQELLEYVIR